MTVNTLTTNLASYYQQELTYTKVALTNEDDLIERSKICWYCLQRCLGACQYAQMMGMRYETAEALFEALRAQLQELEIGA